MRSGDGPVPADGHARPRDACGVIGVIATAPAKAVAPDPAAVGGAAGDPAVAARAYRGLAALQHRGDQSAGIAVGAAGRRTGRVAGSGPVRDALARPDVDALRGDVAVGHVRYATAGGLGEGNIQPIERQVGGVWFALAHNGNLVAAPQPADGSTLEPGASDSLTVAALLAEALAGGACSFEQALCALLPKLTGAYSFVLTDGARLYGLRDPKGLRPLCLGRSGDALVFASETPALTEMGAEFVREVEPGELIVADASGIRSVRPFPAASVEHRLCLFEFVYFSRPDGHLYDRSVYLTRWRAGAALAAHAPLPADENRPEREVLVLPLPDSAIPAAEGYAAHSGLPYGEPLVRNREHGRSFLAAGQGERDRRAASKFQLIPELVRGKRLVVVDDSLVRGTTTRAVTAQLRAAGAAEVHLRIASPPWRWPCPLGIDVGSHGELAAATMTLSAIRDELGVDSLNYLPLDQLLGAVGAPAGKFCTGCLTGDYPVRVPTVPGQRPDDVLVPVAAGCVSRTVPHRTANHRSVRKEPQR
ncbi:amidophosphoribosyltransferase [Krasilnikovia sp. M28-CT-15]|uniref:amidophosphoribosyltransferase n=1 Tax=Krasilnikovia sp. M28-CT-15 TaxID=3373540 RepID=UPI0038778E33